MTFDEVYAIAEQVQFPDYNFVVTHHIYDNIVTVSAEYLENDTVTGEPAEQRTRDWIIPEDATESQVVATLFKCIITSMEHKTREWFTYKKKALFQPHHDVNKLLEICEER